MNLNYAGLCSCSYSKNAVAIFATKVGLEGPEFLVVLIDNATLHITWSGDFSARYSIHPANVDLQVPSTTPVFHQCLIFQSGGSQYKAFNCFCNPILVIVGHNDCCSLLHLHSANTDLTN